MARKQLNVADNQINNPIYSNTDGDNPLSIAKAMSEAHKGNGEYNLVQRTTAAGTFENISGDTSVRDPYTKRDYYYFRPSEQSPKVKKEMIRQCNLVYRTNGLVHSVIDLMSDFTTQGIDIVHPIPRIQRMYKAWADKVNFPERSERLINLVLRMGNTIIKRTTGKLTARKLEKLQKSKGSPDKSTDNQDVLGLPDNIMNDVPDLSRYELPLKYTFLNPLDVNVVGEDLSPFTGYNNYELRIPDNIIRAIRQRVVDDSNSDILGLPSGMAALIRSGSKTIPLDNDKIRVVHYKKDDWQLWADPYHYSILSDLIDFEKARLADRTALDAAASRIRIWRLGNLDNKIIPARAAFIKLNNMLMSLSSGGCIDIIWTPDIEVEELSTDTVKFLGSAKYDIILRSIYAGLGIPSTLTGGGGESGFTNNFVSIKTLLERLNYLRELLTYFWNYEFRLIQQALEGTTMGHKKLPTLVFSHMTLTDDTSEKALLVQLADRDIVSVEAVQRRFGETPELEDARIRKEYKHREIQKKPEKASPYHKTGNKKELQKISLQQGLITPQDTGVDSSLDTKKILMQKAKPKGLTQNGGPKGQPGQGRPKNSNDITKRKQKIVNPRSKAYVASLISWARDAQSFISDKLTPVYLQSCGKKNLRQLTDDEAKKFEEFKFVTLYNLPAHSKLTDENLNSIVTQPLKSNSSVKDIFNEALNEFKEKVNQSPTIEDIRNIQVASFVAATLGENDG